MSDREPAWTTPALRPIEEAIERRLRDWTVVGYVRAVWAKAPAAWPAAPPSEVPARTGWLDLPARLRTLADALHPMVESVRSEAPQDVVVLGMGGSSLAPAVFAATFPPVQGAPRLRVLDSTHPAAVRGLADALDLERTVFLVSSKSGSTIEPLSFYRYFRSRLGGADPGRRFIAITDPGTGLEALARTEGFRAIVPAPPDVGGRYSALSVFGIVPAALAGVDLDRLVRSSDQALATLGPTVPVADNAALRLGAMLGELGRAGRDKITILADAPLATFPDWAEQLIAESTGKRDTGLVPIAHEPLRSPTSYAPDRVFVTIGPTTPTNDAWLGGLVDAGHPVVRRPSVGPDDLAAEFLLWELAIAAAGSVLGIDPFDQPDVEHAKELARAAMNGTAPAAGNPSTGAALPTASAAATVRTWIEASEPRDYLGIHAYLAPAPAVDDAVADLRRVIGERFGRTTTFGYGPRFLHSTGQLHKGGPAGARFLQLVDPALPEVPVPGASYSFGTLIRAQAIGDRQALEARQRTVVTIDVGPEASESLRGLVGVLDG